MWTAADVLLHIDELAGHFGRGMREVALRSYPVLPIAVPIACVAGVVLCLTRAARNAELTAIQTGGIRLQAALAPILVACASAVARLPRDRGAVAGARARAGPRRSWAERPHAGAAARRGGSPSALIFSAATTTPERDAT
jgi:hypothetical protein